MKNLRKWVMAYDDRENFDEEAITHALKAAGFTFVHDQCPVKLTKPWAAVENEQNGSVTWTQWEEE